MTQAIRTFVGAVANRDPDLMAQLAAHMAARGVGTVELSPEPGFDIAPLLANDVELVLVKLTSRRSNAAVLGQLRRGPFRYLNSLRSVELCQSRRATFAFVRRRLPGLCTPRAFGGKDDAARALARGRSVWIRRDAHNIPTAERVLGVARTGQELHALAGAHPDRSLFFQEYLGVRNETYKAYVVGTWVTVLRRTGRQSGVEPDRDLVVEQVELAPEVRGALLEIGAAFGMSVYGVDFFRHEDDVVFVDFNDFPSFRGIPDAAQAICELATRALPAGLTGSSGSGSRRLP